MVVVFMPNALLMFLRTPVSLRIFGMQGTVEVLSQQTLLKRGNFRRLGTTKNVLKETGNVQVHYLVGDLLQQTKNPHVISAVAQKTRGPRA